MENPNELFGQPSISDEKYNLPYLLLCETLTSFASNETILTYFY